MKTVLLHSAYTELFSYYADWIDIFKSHSKFDTECFNVLENQIDLCQIQKAIEASEIIVLHHSMTADTLNYLNAFVTSLQNRKGKLIAFVGNEYNFPTNGMAAKIEILKELGTDIIVTQLLQEAGDWLYAECSVSKVISLPHALNPNAFFSTTPYSLRKNDIGTRSARYSVYIGDDDRNHIIEFIYQNASKYNLTVDLGLEQGSQQRFNRQEWCEFLGTCKSTLSCEAGSFYLDKNDVLVNQILNYLKDSSPKFILPHDSLLRKLYHNIVPAFFRKRIVGMLKDKIIELNALGDTYNFSEIYQKFFAYAPICPVYSKAISSRHFDAIGTKTLQIMYPGRYNDILKPQEHYFPLNKDHSNMEELKSLLSNTLLAKQIIDRAYNHVINAHTHKNRLDYLAQVVEEVS